MSYSLYIWDSSRTSILYWPKDLSDIGQVVEHLAKESPGFNKRFERLAQHLLRRFPLPIPKPAAGASKEEIEAYLDQEESVWRSGNPVEEVRQLQGALWMPDIDPARAAEVLSVLLPMARELYLDVFDDQQGVYFPPFFPGRQVIPPERANVRYALDPGAANPPKFTKATVRKHFIARLTPALAPHGFEPVLDPNASISFRREIDGGYQLITGLIGGSSPDYRCDLSLESLSRRFYAIRLAAARPSEPSPNFDFYGSAFLTSVKSIRNWLVPGWQLGGDSEYARSPEEMDWMVEDLLRLGLPLLEKARTVEGMAWLYTSEDAQTVFPGNFWAGQKIRSIAAHKVLPYARLAGNLRFEEMASYLSTCDYGMVRDNPKGLREIVDYCRNVLQPVGSGPA